MARTVLELKCIKCGTRFEKSFDRRRGDLDHPPGETIRLGGPNCPNHCGSEWFTVEKQHPIRKFKRHYC